MKTTVSALILLLIVPVLATAQNDGRPPFRGDFYNFLGVGAGTGSAQVGFGGEGLLCYGLGVGADATYVSWGGGEYHKAWVGSADFSYHFARHVKSGSVDPFVQGGLSVVGPAHAGDGRGTPAGNYGGGANFWLSRHAGFRLELRDVAGASKYWSFDHYVSFRFGMTFK